jgi:2-polyprenyl-6-methoxyphenol hydroxylase-like FAD-dependent oxidoreductase
VRGFDADDSGVTVGLEGGDDVRAAWLVGCDGGRSLIRRLANIEFPGTDPEITGRQGVFTSRPDALVGGRHESDPPRSPQQRCLRALHLRAS